MKVTQVELFPVPPRWLFVKVSTDEGVAGWGEPIVEGKPQATSAAVHELSRHLIGRDPRQIEDIVQVLFRCGFYRGGPVLCSALAGLEQALWDIKGKALGLPIYELLGGKVRDRIRVYGHIGVEIDRHTPLDRLRERARVLADEGLTALKMAGTGMMGHLGKPADIDAAVRRVAAVREEVGLDFDIAQDFHGRVHRGTAKQLLRELEPFRLLFVEEPVLPEHGELFADIAASTTIPIAAGERLFHRWDFKHVLHAGGLAVVQPDCSHACGIWEVRKIAAMAEAYDIAVAPHCPLGPMTFAASLQIDACTPNFLIQESCKAIRPENKAVVPEDYLVDPSVFEFKDGYIDVPTGPGLGIEVNEDFVREQSKQAHSFKDTVWRLPDGGYAEW